MKSFKVLLPKGVKITHSQYVGSLENNTGESQITLLFNKRGYKTRKIALIISDKYKDNPEIGYYKGLTIGNKSDYDRGIIKGDYSFVIQKLAEFNHFF